MIKIVDYEESNRVAATAELFIDEIYYKVVLSSVVVDHVVLVVSNEQGFCSI